MKLDVRLSKSMSTVTSTTTLEGKITHSFEGKHGLTRAAGSLRKRLTTELKNAMKARYLFSCTP